MIRCRDHSTGVLGTPVFVAAEFDGSDSTLAALTVAHPGSSIDGIADPPITRDGIRIVPFVWLFRGIPLAKVRRALGDFERQGREVEVLSETPAADRLLARAHVTMETSMSRGVQVVARFLGALHNPWVHIDDGRFYVRARVSRPAEAEVLALRLDRTLKAACLLAQVDVQALDRHDLSVWEELVEATIGLSR